MSKNTSYLLILWNLVLSVLLGWSLTRSTAPAPRQDLAETEVPAERPAAITRDTMALQDARIAFFYMDSVQKKYELIAEKDKRFRSEGQRLEGNLKSEMAKAQARYEELMRKDHTYSTQAEVAKDEQELQELMARIQGQQARSEEQLARMEAEMLTEITKELRDHLGTFNKSAGFDYIFSVQNGGQIWVGNPGLDVTDELISGLNERYRAAKTRDH
ncbi:MAG TPA: OmpH family outer membrane protein [Flavobacteriales bacterium]|nr:OmpH family outer membrane protein [Flavobacteriales bacterium]HNU55556.1 OmpH family outer membrane protein [Flavobacteriales bacterium]